MKTNYINDWLREHLSVERYEHSIGVAEMAQELALRYHLDSDKAYLAGLLHDCAKCETNEKLFEIIKSKMNDIIECKIRNYKTFHAPVSAYYAKIIFNVEDSEILSAIRWHTLGRTDMTLFEMIIFLADKIERRTRDKDETDMILNILDKHDGEIGLKLALLECFNRTIHSLVDRQLEICSVTIDVYNELISYKNTMFNV